MSYGIYEIVFPRVVVKRMYKRKSEMTGGAWYVVQSWTMVHEEHPAVGIAFM